MARSGRASATNRNPAGVGPARGGPGWLRVGLSIIFALLVAPAWAQLPALQKGQASEPAAEPAAARAPDARASYATLADLLENDAQRGQLIEQLRELAAGQPPARSGASPAPSGPAPAHEPSAGDSTHRPDAGLDARIVEQAQDFLESAAGNAASAVFALRQLFTGKAADVLRLPDWPNALWRLALVAVATLAAFLILRVVAARLYRRMDAWIVGQAQAGPPAGGGTAVAAAPAVHAVPVALDRQMRLFYSRALVIVGSLIADIAAVMLAAAAGYGAALYLAASAARPGPFEIVFVHAFVVVETGRVLVRMIFARRFRHLRLFPMADDLSHYWNDRLERVVAVGGYGLLLVAPVLADLFSPALGRAFGLIVMLAVYWYAVRVFWKNRAWVGTRIRNHARESDSALLGTVLRMLARTWHLAAIAYCTIMLVVSQVDPERALPYMVYGTLQSALAIGIGVLASAVLGSLLSRRLALPEDIRSRLPMLEPRLNAYIPAVLKGARLIVAIVVILFVLDAWRAFSLADWIVSERGGAAIAAVVRVAVVLLVAAAAWTVLASIIEHRLSSQGGQQPTARERTLLALFRNAALIVIVTMAALIVLSQIGIDIGPLIAGAGVVGLAIGFGAQKLVQDVINGVFIQLENGMNQNDVVEVGGVFGTVEKITIRSVGIRTLDGGYHMIPFSSVDKVANHMRDFSYHLGEYTVAYRESVDDAAYHLERAFEELMTDPVLAPEVLEDMTIAGVTSLNERGFTIRVLIKTNPGMQWAVQRGYNRLVKKHFNAAGIELPYPHTVVYFGQDKDGVAPPMRVRKDAAQPAPAGGASPAGHMRRPLQADSGRRPGDVLGNELATVVDEDGQVTNNPGTTATRDAAEEERDADRDGRS